jgi:hypothetical protein
MFGPVDVAANSMTTILTGVAAPSEAGYITSAQATLVDANGKQIPQSDVVLHHGVWLNPEKHDMTCNSYDGQFPNWERFFASGKERSKFALPKGYGYYWSDRMPQPYTQSAPFWGLDLELMGMGGANGVFLQLDMTFVPEAQARDMTPITPAWLDVANCRTEPVFTVRKGSGKKGEYTKRWSYTMPAGGRFVFLGGHLHDGGVRIGVTDDTAKQQLYTSRAEYGMRDGHMDPMVMSDMDPMRWLLTGMTSYSSARGVPVAKGDRLTLSATYDSTHTWRDVMGIMFGALADARK